MDQSTERYYRVLNLESTATPEEIYEAYRDLARVWDPQRFAHSPRLEIKAEEKLKEIIDAYHALQPEGFAGRPESAGGRSVDDEDGKGPARPNLPPDPFAPPEPPARMIADLHRPTDLPRVSAPSRPTPVVLPPQQPQSAPVLPQTPHGGPSFSQQPQGGNSGSLLHPQPAAQQTALSATQTFGNPVAPMSSTQTFTGAPQGQLSSTQTFAGSPQPSLTQTFTGPMPEMPPASKKRYAVSAVIAGGAACLICGAFIFLYEALWAPAPAVQKAPPLDIAALPVDVPQTKAPDLQTAEPPPQPEQEESAAEPSRVKRARRTATTPERPRQLATGTELMTPMGHGAGRFHIANQSGQDAVARVSPQSSPEAAVRLVYIQTGTDVTIEDIAPGVYYVSFSMGPVTSRLKPFGRRYGPFQFIQIQSTSGYQSDQYQISLKPQPGSSS